MGREAGPPLGRSGAACLVRQPAVSVEAYGGDVSMQHLANLLEALKVPSYETGSGHV